FTLYPGKAYIEITGKLYNRTPFPQTFLWWANPAVKVNDHYQSIFPPDVHAVYDHGKRDVSSFPIAKGVYYKVNYAPGTDISKYKNIRVPTSYMAVSSKYNFIGGYEHDTRGGLLHVADHHIAPGKKQWTWGNGEFGRRWDDHLTDEDGPYIELMTGVYTDNQPDFSWIQPYEEKSFVQYFMPYREVGMVKNATKDVVVNLETNGKWAEIRLYVTSAFEEIKVELLKGDEILFTETISSSPENPYIKKVALQDEKPPEDPIAIGLKLMVTDMTTGKELISYQQEKYPEQEIPSPAERAKYPADVENNEQLFLTGLHLEQYRHATYKATDYYEEALRRDPKDARSNNAMGLWFLRRGRFGKAVPHFEKAIETITQRNPNPYDGEPYYNLGWALKMQNKNDKAYDAFYKSTWNDAWQHAGYLNLARLAVMKEDNVEALDFIQKSLVKNYHSHTARHAKSFILRKLNRYDLAAACIDESLELDPFNFGCLFEKYLLLAILKDSALVADEVLSHLKTISRNDANNFIEYAFDYAHAGLFDEAIELLTVYKAQEDQNTLVEYYMGWFASQSGNQLPNSHREAMEHFQNAAQLSPDYVFPNKIEDVRVLQKAIEMNPKDANAPYYLGNFWFDKKQYEEAIACWEQSVWIDNTFPTVHRNLALAYYNKLSDPAKALTSMEKAFVLDKTDARVLMELDQLYKRLNKGHKERLHCLEEHLSLVNQRDDLYLERITLHNQLGDYTKAKELLSNYKFHPWEGGEGKVIRQYLICHLELAKNSIEHSKYEVALQLLKEAENYPFNLGEGKLAGTQENDIHFLKGLSYDLSGNNNEAMKYYQLATQGISEPAQAIFYNDPQPDKIFYQGLAWVKLGRSEKAFEIFHRLIDFGEAHMANIITIDYFAVSLPDLLVFDANLNLLNKIHCLYLMGLGNLGLGNEYLEKAHEYFNQVLELDINHQGVLTHQSMIPSMSLFGQKKS
ncbi:MAG: DUF5107 domain-containing protein, partial [Ginsengibacter sp.]